MSAHDWLLLGLNIAGSLIAFVIWHHFDLRVRSRLRFRRKPKPAKVLPADEQPTEVLRRGAAARARVRARSRPPEGS